MEKLSKTDIAERQIDTAINLLFEKKDLCSVVTLAGAAEEILGNLLKHRGKIHAVEKMISDVKMLMQELFSDLEIPSEKEMVGMLNYARNQLKHLDQPGKLQLELDLFLAALGMLNRAVDNYEEVMGTLTTNMKRFRTIREATKNKYHD